MVNYSYPELLSQIDQMQCWFHIVGYTQLKEPILNPLRKDTNKGSCYLDEYKGRIVLVDWAHPNYSGSDVIKAYRLLNPTKSWKEVCTDLLKISKNSKPSPYVYPGIVKKSKTTKFVPFFRDWEEPDLEYWYARGVSKFQLDRDSTLVSPIRGYELEKESTMMTYNSFELGFSYKFGEKYKIYYPHRESYRFIGNVTSNDIWHLKRDSETLLVCKSSKDMLVLENLTDFDLTHIQGETYGHPDEVMVFSWETSYKRIILFWDNDEPGLLGMERFAKKFILTKPEIKHLDLGLSKDADELRVKYGHEHSLNIINELLYETNNI